MIQTKQEEENLPHTWKPKQLPKTGTHSAGNYGFTGKYKQTYASTFDETAHNAIQNEKFDPESAICPTCGQNLPEERVERLKTEFEQKNGKIHAELARKERFKADKRQKLKDITEEGEFEVAERKRVGKSAKTHRIADWRADLKKKNVSTLAASEIAEKSWIKLQIETRISMETKSIKRL